MTGKKHKSAEVFMVRTQSSVTFHETELTSKHLQFIQAMAKTLQLFPELDEVSILYNDATVPVPTTITVYPRDNKLTAVKNPARRRA